MRAEDEDTIAKTADNNEEKCLNNDTGQDVTTSPDQDNNSATAAERQINTSKRGGGVVSVGAQENLRKSGSDAEAQMFTLLGAETARRGPGVSQDSLRIPDTAKSCSGSPSKSPSYVRKPMPINEPKPVLPKSKQINVEQETDTKQQPPPRLAHGRTSGESKTEVRAKLVRKFSHNDQSQDNKSHKTKEEINIKNKKMSTSPLSPRLTSKLRPTTLSLSDKKEKIKRSSAVSATPSTDSSKSSKTFEFLDYDDETKEKILCDALKEEDEFLEFVKTLDIEPPDPIIEAGKDAGKQNCESVGTRGQDNLDSLCRMMEEIATLKSENSKLQERLHYIEVSSRLHYSSPEAAGPQIRSWLAETSRGRCVSVGAESQTSDRSGRRGWERSHHDNLQLSPLDDSVASEVKQKLALLTSSSSEELLSSEVFNIDDNLIQRSSSVSDYLQNSAGSAVYVPRRRHSLTTTTLKEDPQTDQKEQQSESTWLKVKNILYKRRESLKKKSFSKEVERTDLKNKSHSVTTPSHCEFIDMISLPTEPPNVLSTHTSSIHSKKKAKTKNPELAFCNPDLLESKVFSQSLNSIKVESGSHDSNLLSPKRCGEDTCHSLPSSPRLNKDDVFFYEDDIRQDPSGTSNLNISVDSRDFQQMEAVR